MAWIKWERRRDDIEVEQHVSSKAKISNSAAIICIMLYDPST